MIRDDQPTFERIRHFRPYPPRLDRAKPRSKCPWKLWRRTYR